MGTFWAFAMLLSLSSPASQGRESTLSLTLIAAPWLRRIVHTLKSGFVESVCASGAYGNLIANPSDGYEYAFSVVDGGVLRGSWPNIAPKRVQTNNNLF